MYTAAPPHCSTQGGCISGPASCRGHSGSGRTGAMLKLSAETVLLELEKAAGQDLLGAWVVLGVLMVAGFLGNVVVVVVYGRRFKPSSTRSFILALAVLDLISTGVCIPLEMVSLSHLYTFQYQWSAMCRVVRYLTASVLASFSVLALISVDRCRRVWRSGRQFRLATVTKILIAAIVGSHIFLIPSLVVNGIQTFNVDSKSDPYFSAYWRLQNESAQTGFPEDNDTAVLNVTGRKCDANDNFKGTPTYVYIGLLLIVITIDALIIIIMYGAIGIKAFGAIRRNRTSTLRTSSSNVSNPDIDLEPQNSDCSPSEAEGRNSESASVRYSASNSHGNDEGRASIHHRLSKVRRRSKKNSSASQKKHLSLRPLLQLSGSSEFCIWAWDASSKSSSWPRRRGKEPRKSVQDLPGVEQEESAEEERNREQIKRARSQSLSFIFNSGGERDPPEPRSKKPSVSLIIPGGERTCQDSSDSEGYVSKQDKDTNKRSPGLQTESQDHEQGGRTSTSAEDENRDHGNHDIPAEIRSRGGIRDVGRQSEIVLDPVARVPSGQVDALARSRTLQLRRRRMAEGSRTTLMLFLVTVTFLVSGLPYMAAKLLEFTRPELVRSLQGPSLVLYHLGLRSYFLQSAANPILYSLCVPNFRQQCRRLLSVARRR